MQSFAHFSLFCALNSSIMKKNIAIFASGSGSNAENIIRYFQKSDSATVSLVLSNKSDAYVLERSHRLKVPCNVFPKEDWIAGDEILAILQEYRIDFIVLAGFLVRVPDLLLHAYPGKIINIHPALLPKFGGKGMYGDKVHEAVVAAGEKESVLLYIILMNTMTKEALSSRLPVLYFPMILPKKSQRKYMLWNMSTFPVLWKKY